MIEIGCYATLKWAHSQANDRNVAIAKCFLILKRALMKKFIPLRELEVYLLSRQLSQYGWDVFDKLHWEDKKIMGNQFITALDSVGANIAEGYARFHYLDKVKFYYYSRGSLSEAINHWLELLAERDKIERQEADKITNLAKQLEIKLNRFIKTTLQQGERS